MQTGDDRVKRYFDEAVSLHEWTVDICLHRHAELSQMR